MKRTFNYAEVDKLLGYGQAVDGTAGGLVLGPSHIEGGIYVLEEAVGYFNLTCEIEGFEFIFSPVTSHLIGADRFTEINTESGDIFKFEPYSVPEHIRVIDAVPVYPISRRYIVFRGRGLTFCMTNKQATKERLDYINNMNNSFDCLFDSDVTIGTTTMMALNPKTKEVVKSWPIRYPSRK